MNLNQLPLEIPENLQSAETMKSATEVAKIDELEIERKRNQAERVIMMWCERIYRRLGITKIQAHFI